MKQTKEITVFKINNGSGLQARDVVIKEQAYTLFVNDREVVTLVCSPCHLKELAAGFLCAEGFISSRKDLVNLAVNHNDGLIWAETSTPRPKGFLQRSITSCCGRAKASFYFQNDVRNICPVHGDIKISARQLSSLGREIESKGELFQATGGAHGAALCLPDKILRFFEDVGRHNAVDKVFGHCVLHSIPRHDKLLLLTGRISSEILLKAARMGVPLLASRSAPTDLALKLAEQLGITVAGFVRNGRMNVYTYPERVIDK